MKQIENNLGFFFLNGFFICECLAFAISQNSLHTVLEVMSNAKKIKSVFVRREENVKWVTRV